jgi:uncharacterized membrane protein
MGFGRRPSKSFGTTERRFDLARIAARYCIAAIAIASIIAGCGPKEAARPEGGLTLTDAQEAEYHSEWVQAGRVALSNGEYSDREARLTIRLADLYAFGDLDGNGSKDAAVVLVTDPGGSGTFFDLAVLSEREGAPENVASQALGDRVDLRQLTIEGGRIIVDMVTHGPNDPMCCPSLHEIVTFELEGESLTETARKTVAGKRAEGSDLVVSGEFKALGNEPFWNVEIGATIAFERMGEGKVVFPYAPPERTAGGYSYSSTVVEPAAHSIEIFIEREACMDSMSGARFDYSATVSFDGREYSGCAKAGSRI